MKKHTRILMTAGFPALLSMMILSGCGEAPAETVSETEAAAESVSEAAEAASETEASAETTTEAATEATSETTSEATETTAETTETAAESTEAVSETEAEVIYEFEHEWAEKIFGVLKNEVVSTKDNDMDRHSFLSFPPEYYRHEIALDDYDLDGVPELILKSGGEDNYYCKWIYSLDGELLYSYLGSYNYDTNDYEEESYSIYKNTETGEKNLMISGTIKRLDSTSEYIISFADCIEFSEGTYTDYETGELKYSGATVSKKYGAGSSAETEYEDAETIEDAAALKEKYFGKYEKTDETVTMSNVYVHITDLEKDLTDEAIYTNAELLVNNYLKFMETGVPAADTE